MARFVVLLIGIFVTVGEIQAQALGGKTRTAPSKVEKAILPAATKKTKDALTVDKEKLLELTCLPPGGVMFQFFAFKITETKRVGGATEIQALKSKLTADPGAAELYVQLGDLLSEKKLWMEAYGKAVELFPRRLDLDKQNGLLWAQYAQALQYLKKTEAAEAPALKAVQLAPKDWRCWQTLGWVRWSQWFDLAVAARTRKLTQSERKQANRYFEEEQKCRDVELKLAPNEPQAYRDRLMFRLSTPFVPAKFFVADLGEVKNVYKKAFAAMLSDARELVRLCPDDLDAHLALAAVVSLDGMFNLPDDAADNLGKKSGQDLGDATEMAGLIWGALPNESKKVVRELTVYFAKRANEPSFPARGSQALAYMSFVQGDMKTAIHHARRATRLEPKTKANWDLLIVITMARFERKCIELASKSAKKELSDEKAKELVLAELRTFVEACTGCVNHLHNVQYSLFASDFLIETRQFGDAEKILRNALKNSPNDAQCRIGLAAVLLLESDQPAGLAKARECLDLARKSLKGSNDQALRSHLQFLEGIYLALAGSVHESHAHFRAMQKADPKNNLVKDALAAFSH